MNQKLLYEGFLNSVKKTPNKLAVKDHKEELTYLELFEKSSRVAFTLSQLNIKKEYIPIIGSKTVESIIGILGILLSENTYVGLDINQPANRFDHIFSSLESKVLIITDINTRLEKELKKLKTFPRYILNLTNNFYDKLFSNSEKVSIKDNFINPPKYCSESIAYTLFTSGSTGVPKGVCVSHRAACAALDMFQSHIQLTNIDNIGNQVALCFDLSVFDIFSTLNVGAFLSLIPPEMTASPNYFFEEIENSKITSLLTVPSTLNFILNNHTCVKNINSTIKKILLSGEPVSQALLDQIFEKFPNTVVWNLYGATEIPYALAEKLEMSKDCQCNFFSLKGKEVEIKIQESFSDKSKNIQLGELGIKSPAIFTGYLINRNLPLSLPLDSDGWYLTGDLGSINAFKQVTLHGRIDRQIKILGHRIELDEIEYQLKNCHLIKDIAVIYCNQTQKLIAYIILSDDKIKNKEIFHTITNHCNKNLSLVAHPSEFRIIKKMPYTASGKINRKVLPTLTSYTIIKKPKKRINISINLSIEERLSSIWSEILRIEKIGIHDNFFKLGGHSLLATQVISRIRSEYNIDLPLQSLFEHPTIKSLSEDIQEFINKKNVSQIPPIIPQQRPQTLPLSFAQQRLWFLDQLIPDSALYNIPLALKLSGPLNLDALEKAFNDLIQRHESLRTIFPTTQGEANQVILPHNFISISQALNDLSNLCPEEQLKSIDIFASQEANTPFNLASGPLIHLKILKLSQHEHALLITMHHIISDGWSIGILFKEISSLYNAYVRNNEISLSPLPIQYADFTLWQRQWLQGDVLETQLSYWKQQLSDIPDLLELPTDKPRPKELTYKGAFYHYTLSKEIKDQLNALAHQQGVSLFMTLLTLFQILLYRYTGQKTIVVGSPIANRHYQEIETLIGFFVNTLALKTNFEDNETFLSILEKVKETTLQAYQHQDISFEQLVDHLNITRSLNRNPVFQVMFSLDKLNTEEELMLENIETCPIFSDYPISKFDLSLSALEHEEGIDIGFEYATDLFEKETIQRMGTHFEELIKSILQNPTERVSSVSFLTPQEKQTLLIDWNKTEVSYPDHKTIHQLFEEQVEKTPNNIAVVYEEQELTYQELNEKANQLAHYLRTLGLRPDMFVAISVERSLEMIIGLLAILKAGGAYVPLDPEYPQERLQFMLDDTNAPILITQSHLKEKLKKPLASYKGKTLFLDKLQKTLQLQYNQNLPSLSLPHNLAYVIYTSGSTGKPKGVKNTNEAINNRLEWTLKSYSISQKDSFLYIASMGFDISLWEMIFPLSTGARLVIAKREENKDINAITDLIKKHKITTLHFVPSLLDLFTNSAEVALCQSIRQIITGGEALSNNVKQKFINLFQEANLYLAYGPTEAAISVTHWNCREKNYDYKIPIGYPISNTQIYILDSSMNPVPIGVNGEIYIGGMGLARGYLNRPDLTAEKFVPNPFVNPSRGENSKLAISLRLYRTGDLARYLPDGNIEFIGRIDDQIKMRGFRIELKEIEHVLCEHGDINQAVVIAYEDKPDHKILVAYIVPGSFIPAISEIQEFLSKKLPDYMIPSFFGFIDKIPLTPNGKIDRKALPAPDFSLRQSEEEYVAPQTPLQNKLFSIWSEVLNRKNISINDNFFRIGGDSIISIQLVAKARQKGIHLSAKDIFNYPTIEALSLVVENKKETLSLLPEQNSVKGYIPLTPVQHWFFKQNLIDKNHFNQSILLCIKDGINSALLQQAFKTLTHHHDVLRCLYNQELSGNWLQENLKHQENVYVWNEFDFSSLSDEEITYEIEQQANILQQGLNINKGPLLSLAFFNCGKNKEGRFLIIIHHLVIDGVSWRILLEDLDTIYQYLEKKQYPILPSKTHSYQQWAQMLLSYAQSETVKQQITYWQNVERSIKPLSINFRKEENTIFPDQKTFYLYLKEEETTELLQKVPKAYHTQINDILLTALTLAIGDLTQDYSLSLILEGHGREDIIKDIDLSRTIGWFTSIFPVHLKIKAPNNLGEAIRTVKETLQEIPHKGVGYGILKYLTPGKPLSTEIISSYPMLYFNYLGQWDNIQAEESFFTFAEESSGNSVSPNNFSASVLEVNSEIKNGKLHVLWQYNPNFHYSHLIELLANTFLEKLRLIIKHCSQNYDPNFNPRNFDLTITRNLDLAERLALIPIGD